MLKLSIIVATLALLGTLRTDAAIIYQNLGDLVVSKFGQQERQRDIDLDGDDIADITFQNIGVDFSAIPGENLRIVGSLDREDQFARNFAIGSLISSATLDETSLLSRTSIFSSQLPTDPLPTLVGEFRDEGYMRFVLSQEDGPKYGWFHLTSFSSVGGVLHEFAFENQSGVGILTGAVPEPSSTSMLALSVAVLASHRRRRFLQSLA